jgi:tetratricopeptide (TPR) repeat protein
MGCNSESTNHNSDIIELIGKYYVEEKFDSVLIVSEDNPIALKDYSVRYIRAEIFFNRNQLENAHYEILAAMDAADVDNVYLFTLKGKIEERRGLTLDAITSYKKAISIDSSSSEAFYRLGIIHSKENLHTDTALRYFEIAIFLNDSNSEYYNYRGVVLEQMQQYRLALSDYTTAIQLDSSNAKYYYNASVSAFLAGDTSLALALAERSIELNSSQGMYFENKATILLLMGDTLNACLSIDMAPRWFKCS